MLLFICFHVSVADCASTGHTGYMCHSPILPTFKTCSLPRLTLHLLSYPHSLIKPIAPDSWPLIATIYLLFFIAVSPPMSIKYTEFLNVRLQFRKTRVLKSGNFGKFHFSDFAHKFMPSFSITVYGWEASLA